MNQFRLPKTQSQWIVRIFPSLILITLGWIYRSEIFIFANQIWTRNLVLGIFALAILDILIIIQKPISLLISSSVYFIKNRLYNRSSSFNVSSTISSADRPITKISEDQLGFTKYAVVLARNIAQCQTPLTFGIHGEWGAGKTSLARLIQQFLTPHNEKDEHYKMHLRKWHLEEVFPNSLLKKFEIININAWQYASSNALWRALILVLAQRLEEKGLSNISFEWQRKLYYSINQESKGNIQLNSTSLFVAALQTIISFIGSLLLPSTWFSLGLKVIGIKNLNAFSFESFSDLFEREKISIMRKQMESVEEFQGALQELISNLLGNDNNDPAKRVIIFIDDLDRCLPSVALEIMETVKTFLDVPGCVYVLLCDQQLLGQGVKAKFKELLGEESDAHLVRGREYIEKIIQVPFQIPPTNRERLEKFARLTLGDVYENKAIPYFEIVYSTVGNNPRKIKRLCQGLEIAFDMMELSLEDLESKEPVQDEINQNKEILENITQKPAEQRSPNRKKEFAKVFCLQYRWPFLLPILRSYQAQNESTEVFIPELARAAQSTGDGKMIAPEDQRSYLYEARKEIDALVENKDNVIFWDFLANVDWEKARVAGRNGIVRHNPALWKFLETEPYFSSMDKEDLKSYIEWSGVIINTDKFSSRLSSELAETPVERETPGSRLSSELAETPVEALDLSMRVFNSLKHTGITTVGDVLDLLEKGETAVTSIRNFGENSLDELRDKMREKGYMSDENQ